MVIGRLVSVWGWFKGSSKKLDTRRRLSEISLSRIFFLFSLCRYFDRCWESWAEGWAWCGRRFAWGLQNSAVTEKLASFSETKFFFSFSVFFFFPFFSFFLSRVVTVQDLGSLLKRTTSLLSLKAGRSEFYLAPYVPNYSPSLTLEMGGLLSRRSQATLTHANLRIISNK